MFDRETLFRSYVQYTVIPFLSAFFFFQSPMHESFEPDGSALVIFPATMKSNFNQLLQLASSSLPGCHVFVSVTNSAVEFRLIPRSAAWRLVRAWLAVICYVVIGGVLLYAFAQRVVGHENEIPI